MHHASIRLPGEEQQEQWRMRLAQAADNYRAAASRFKRIVCEHNPATEVENARTGENKARSEYLRVLRIFTDFVLYGRTPPQ